VSNSSGYDYSAPPSAGSVASPNGYTHFPPNYSYPQQPSGPSYPPAPYDNRPYMSAPRVEEVKGGFVGRPIPGQPHSDSVKRHLDVYDVETSLNEVWIFFGSICSFGSSGRRTWEIVICRSSGCDLARQKLASRERVGLTFFPLRYRSRR
jgi:hypothetical protein